MGNTHADAVRTYTVTLTSELLDGPLVADVPASSPRLAALRLRNYAFHAFREPSMLQADCDVEEA